MTPRTLVFDSEASTRSTFQKTLVRLLAIQGGSSFYSHHGRRWMAPRYASDGVWLLCPQQMPPHTQKAREQRLKQYCTKSWPFTGLVASGDLLLSFRSHSSAPSMQTLIRVQHVGCIGDWEVRFWAFLSLQNRKAHSSHSITSWTSTWGEDGNLGGPRTEFRLCLSWSCRVVPGDPEGIRQERWKVSCGKLVGSRLWV